MPAYSFEAVDPQGQPRKGVIEADTARAARSQLRAQSLVPLSVEPVKGSQADADGAYGHVAVLEKINADGSIEISESNAKGLGVISTRTFSAAEAGKFQYVHY